MPKDEMNGDRRRPDLQPQGSSPPKNWRSARGSATFELAATATLILSILFGTFGFGEALFAYHSLSEAAREATRYAVVRGANSPSPVTADQMKTYVNGILPGLNTANVTTLTTWSPNNSPGGVVSVKLSYTYSFNIPLLPTAAINMTSTSKMTISQ